MNKHARAARQCATYFQIPLCALAFGSSDRDRLDAIISYALVEAGRKKWNTLSEEERARFLDTAKRSNALPTGFNPECVSHCHVICGASVTNVINGSMRFFRSGHIDLWDFIKSFQQRHGQDALVRLKTKLVFEARDGKGITPCELYVLAAIYSVIGRKQGPVLITQDRIRCRALGYKTKAVMAAELPRRKDGAQPLSDWQLRSLLDRLQARRFFARVTYGRRLSYYSHRMRESELRHALVEMKTFRFANKTLRRFDDDAMTEAIRNQRASLEGRRPPAPDAVPLEAPSRRLIPEEIFETPFL